MNGRSFFAPIKASREIRPGPVSREAAKLKHWFILKRITPQLAARGCAAAVSLRPGRTRTSKKHNDLQNICREFNPSSLSYARTPSPPAVAFAPPPSRFPPPPPRQSPSGRRPAGPPPAPRPHREHELEVPARAPQRARGGERAGKRPRKKVPVIRTLCEIPALLPPSKPCLKSSFGQGQAVTSR